MLYVFPGFVAKGLEAMLLYAERIMAHSASMSERHVEAAEKYIKSLKTHEELMARLFPMSTMNVQEKLEKVAAHCGLAMPIASKVVPDNSRQSKMNQ